MAIDQATRVIAVTGTKGKTSVVRVLAAAMNAAESQPVLSVDTDRVRLGREDLFGINKSRQNAGFLPSMCPGRFLALLGDGGAAVLEATVGCARVGLGYRYHQVGIFTNVIDDHIGIADYLGSRTDIAQAKASFIFGNIMSGGCAIVNYDDALVMASIPQMDIARKNITVIPCSLDRQALDDYPTYASADSQGVYIYSNGQRQAGLDYAATPWLLDGMHQPTIRNAMFALAALWGFYGNNERLQKAIAALSEYRFERDGGRLVRYKTANGMTVIVDFAHERESLGWIAQYARKLTRDSGRVIGVIRMGSSRPDRFVEQTGRVIAPFYDEIIVYDRDLSKGIAQHSSSTSRALFEGIVAGGCGACRIIPLDIDALQYVRSIANSGDVVVFIANTMKDDERKLEVVFEKLEVIS